MDGPTIATLVVAGATFVLAGATFKLGKRAQEEVRAQWRPVLLIDEEQRLRRTVRGYSNDADPKLSLEGRLLRVIVANVGRGPALDVTAMSPQAVRPASPNSIISHGRSVMIEMDLTNPPIVAMVTLGYSDISQGSYTTTILVSFEDDRPKVVSQQFNARPPLLVSRWWRLLPRRIRRRAWRATARARGYRV